MSHELDREILTEENRLTEATRNADVDVLNQIYADDILFTGVTGVVCDKDAVMDEARRGLIERQKAAASGTAAVVAYDKDELRGVRHENMGAATYRFTVTIRNDGQDVVRRYRTTNVWAKRSGRWQVVLAQTTSVG